MELIKHKQIEPFTVENIPVEVRDKNYVHTQAASDTVWMVRHSLGKIPNVMCYQGNNIILGDIIIDDTDIEKQLNELTIIFNFAVKGKAICN